MSSLLDHPAVSENLFYPRPFFAPPPPGARDLMVAVAPGVRLHARLHDDDRATISRLMTMYWTTGSISTASWPLPARCPRETLAAPGSRSAPRTAEPRSHRVRAGLPAPAWTQRISSFAA